MITERRNNLFHVCALVEFIARETKNHRGDIVARVGLEGVRKLLKDAPVNHCLSFEQVASETIDRYRIPNGTFDTITGCPYRIPSATDIGRLYTYLIEDINSDEARDAKTLVTLFGSFLSDAISDFKTGIYFENLSYLLASYRAGKLLDAA